MIEDFIRRAVERAIHQAEHPKGASLHSGKAVIEASYLRRMLAMLDAASAPPVQGTVPIGWKLVPVEPTPEMLAAAHEGDTEYTLRNFGDVMTVSQGPYDHYVAMLDAAPTPPAQENE